MRNGKATAHVLYSSTLSLSLKELTITDIELSDIVMAAKTGLSKIPNPDTAPEQNLSAFGGLFLWWR